MHFSYAFRYHEAIPLFEKALKAVHVSENERVASLNLALCLLRTGQIDEAMVLFRRCVESFPPSREACCGLALCLISKGDLESALEPLDRALAFDGESEFTEALLDICMENWNQRHTVVVND